MFYDAFWHASLTLSHISLDFIRFLGSLLHSKSALAAREHTIWVRSFYSLSFLHFLPEWDRIYGQTKLLDVLERKTMARPLRVNLPGGYYHVTSRGNERKKIFLHARDREIFLKTLQQVKDRFHWLCHACGKRLRITWRFTMSASAGPANDMKQKGISNNERPHPNFAGSKSAENM